MYYEKAVDEKSYYLFYHSVYDENTEPHFTPPHCHEGFELLIVIKGEVECVLNGEKKILHGGDIVFLDSYDIHSFVFKECERYSLVFSRDYSRMLIDDKMTLPNYPRCDEKSFLEIAAVLEKYYSEYGAQIPNGLLVEGLVSYVLGKIEYQSGKVARRERSCELMVTVLEYIKKNSETELTLTDVAAKFGYTPNYFSTIFNRFVGMNFNDYLNYVRYTRAAEIILLQGCTATEIAMKCGFGSMNTFYRAKNKFDKSVKSDTLIIE